MKCAECKRTLDVGDQYIQFTQTEWAEKEGVPAIEGMDDLFAQIMGMESGEKIIYCKDCTVDDPNGLMLDTVYGDEEWL